MPIYCYRAPDGETRELYFPVGDAPGEFEMVVPRSHQNQRLGCPTKTVVMRRDFAAERVGVPAKGWPLECIASGVHANQAGELRDHLQKAGVPTEVTPDGNPVYRDAAHRRRALKVRGMVDRSSFL